MHSGPHIKRDGLVFGYDTGRNPSSNFDSKSTHRRHFKGKPVANRLSYGDDFNFWSGARNSGSYPTIDVKVAKGPFKGTKADRLSLPSDGSYPRIYQSFTPTTTSTHTFSVWLKGETTGQGCFVGCFRNSPWALPSQTNFSITTEWKHYSFAVNPADTTFHQIYIGSHNSHGGKVFLIYGAQLEVGTVASPFNVNSRLSTQSLIDLTKTTNIDVSNVSFDSDGLLTFDGTDDFINTNQTPTELGIHSSSYTMEAIFKLDSTSGDNMVFGTNQTSQFNGLHNGVRNGVFYHAHYSADRSAGTAYANTWYHVIWVHTGSLSIMYVNGSPINSLASHGAFTSTYNVWIGRHWGYFDGKIPVAKIYNRALSAQEVKQSFKAYKNRFNLS